MTFQQIWEVIIDRTIVRKSFATVALYGWYGRHMNGSNLYQMWNYNYRQSLLVTEFAESFHIFLLSVKKYLHTLIELRDIFQYFVHHIKLEIGGTFIIVAHLLSSSSDTCLVPVKNIDWRSTQFMFALSFIVYIHQPPVHASEKQEQSFTLMEMMKKYCNKLQLQLIL